jgi:tRNA-splicing ligase RtcB (3'-phosphate/5'-hydroxy nucleic acid ligase)
MPGSMGTASWVLAGQPGAMQETFGTSCHGAGRLLSRTAAKQGKDVNQVLQDLENAGIIVRSETKNGFSKRSPKPTRTWTR